MEYKEEYELRGVEADDMDLLFVWANDPAVRNNAFHTELIKYEDHKKWFARLLKDESEKQYIYMKDGQPIGQIRFTMSGDEAKIDYSIAPDMRGQGCGMKMLELAKARFHEDYPKIRKLTGQVKSGNHASEKCFIDCSFEEVYHQFEYKY